MSQFLLQHDFLPLKHFYNFSNAFDKSAGLLKPYLKLNGNNLLSGFIPSAGEDLQNFNQRSREYANPDSYKTKLDFDNIASHCRSQI